MTLGLNTAHSYITNTVAHLEWLKKCPNLTRMRWELAGSQFPCDQFAEALQQSTWQRLESLCLTGIQESDQDLAIVMQELPSLTSFEMDACSFGPKCFAWLQVGQFAMIKTLHLRECIKLSSLMTLDILHSCHLLEDLEAFHVALSDLSSNPQQWVCRGLRRLRLYFDNDTNAVDFSWTVFGHLSGLVMLEDLDVDDDFMWEIELVGGTTLDTITTLSTPAPQGLQKRGPPLQWCLNSGLTQLIHLRRLRTLRVEKTFNTARAPDIKWMLEHWPLLQELTGPLVRDDCSAEEWEEMARMLKARGVENHNILFSSGAI
ncbi:hypothetical protein EC991_004504 [Linnemannia zychae]|nr:hypothetical protein EC991_004504 [Linnemannia zychae]